MISHRSLPRKKTKMWRWILLIVVIILLYLFFAGSSLSLHKTVIINRWDTFSKFTQDMGTLQKLKLKWFIKRNGIDLSKLPEWYYVLSGSYSFATLTQQILKGPTQSYIRYTVLEGRSVYDIDADLTKKWYITGGDYIALASDPAIIAKYQNRYAFLANTHLSSLEWFLYPDTYHIDANKNFVDQLIYMQLEAFKSRVRTPYSSQLTSMNNKLQLNGLNLTSFSFDTYKIITLASIVEKEIRGETNKPIVAWIFIKRLSIWMSLGSDVTLCYGLKQPFVTCTPTVIAQNIGDKSNIFNTRQRTGLTPQPIANPAANTIAAVLNYQPSDYLFFLYGDDGQIHYARTNAEHSANKNQYMK